MIPLNPFPEYTEAIFGKEFFKGFCEFLYSMDEIEEIVDEIDIQSDENKIALWTDLGIYNEINKNVYSIGDRFMQLLKIKFNYYMKKSQKENPFKEILFSQRTKDKSLRNILIARFEKYIFCLWSIDLMYPSLMSNPDCIQNITDILLKDKQIEDYYYSINNILQNKNMLMPSENILFRGNIIGIATMINFFYKIVETNSFNREFDPAFGVMYKNAANEMFLEIKNYASGFNLPLCSNISNEILNRSVEVSFFIPPINHLVNIECFCYLTLDLEKRKKSLIASKITDEMLVVEQVFGNGFTCFISHDGQLNVLYYQFPIMKLLKSEKLRVFYEFLRLKIFENILDIYTHCEPAGISDGVRLVNLPNSIQPSIEAFEIAEQKEIFLETGQSISFKKEIEVFPEEIKEAKRRLSINPKPKPLMPRLIVNAMKRIFSDIEIWTSRGSNIFFRRNGVKEYIKGHDGEVGIGRVIKLIKTFGLTWTQFEPYI